MAQSYGSGFFFGGGACLVHQLKIAASQLLGQIENLTFVSINGTPLVVNNRVSPVWLMTKITSLKTGQEMEEPQV